MVGGFWAGAKTAVIGRSRSLQHDWTLGAGRPGLGAAPSPLAPLAKCTQDSSNGHTGHKTPPTMDWRCAAWRALRSARGVFGSPVPGIGIHKPWPVPLRTKGSFLLSFFPTKSLRFIGEHIIEWGQRTNLTSRARRSLLYVASHVPHPYLHLFRRRRLPRSPEPSSTVSPMTPPPAPRRNSPPNRPTSSRSRLSALC